MDGERPLTKAEIDDLQRIAKASIRVKKEVDHFEPQSKLREYRSKRSRVSQAPPSQAPLFQVLPIRAQRPQAMPIPAQPRQAPLNQVPPKPAPPRQALALSAARKSAPPPQKSYKDEESSSDASEDGDPRDLSAAQLAARNPRISPGAMKALEQAGAGAGAGAGAAPAPAPAAQAAPAPAPPAQAAPAPAPAAQAAPAQAMVGQPTDEEVFATHDSSVE